jgi:hypothetical protein
MNIMKNLIIVGKDPPTHRTFQRPAIRGFADRSQSKKPKLNDIQEKVFLQLGKGLSDEDNWNSLLMCRSRYFSILEQLRTLFDVEKNWQLTKLAKDIVFARII